MTVSDKAQNSLNKHSDELEGIRNVACEAAKNLVKATERATKRKKRRCA